MKTAVIISEYNPFHMGHEYLIRSVRERFGEDTAVISVMSGNFTQRGELAILPKQYRAKAAILGGANLVLELPFPFSSSSAEFFAKSAVKIASDIGVADILVCGSECGCERDLAVAADITDSNEYKAAFNSLSEDKTLGYPKKCELAYKMAGGNDSLTFSPNNILAIEYIRAIKSLSSDLKFHTFKRVGADYSCENTVSGIYQSAMAIRNTINEKADYTAFVPPYCSDILADAERYGDMPASIERISSAIISYFRLNPPHSDLEYHDAGDGLYNRLYNSSLEASTISSLFELTETKSYTNARLKRVMWSVFFGVTSSDVRTLPLYTQVLAMDSIGMLLLKKARKLSEIPILTKPSAISELSDAARRQKLLSDKADSVYELSKPEPKSAKGVYTYVPFIKK